MRQFTFVAVSIAFTACSFSASNSTNDGRVVDGKLLVDSNEVRDAPQLDAATQFTVTHLGVVPPDQLNGVFTVPANGHNIDTSTPGGMLNLVFVAQPGGDQLAVAYFDELTIDGDLFVFGTRPLVIVANKIIVNGTIDASAADAKPGPGGIKPGTAGAGNGGKGVSGGINTTNDSGGGGGGFGSPGGAGGTAGLTAGLAGPADALPNLPILRGGAAGGAAPRCMSAIGGAGGGAVQLSARVSITVAGTGSIHAGGGGGKGGGNCAALDAGSGGGSGGAIYLEAPTGSIAGGLWANGGAGGAGRENGSDTGLDGRDGTVSQAPAIGATSFGGDRNGGNGAAFNGTMLIDATAGGDMTNGGGGGGGIGRIVIRGTFVSTGNFSPLPVAL